MFGLVIRNGKELVKTLLISGVKERQDRLDPVNTSKKRQNKSLTPFRRTKYLSAGWIDDHVHCFEEMTLYYDYPDEIGVDKGVTTVIDAGTTGAENIHTFYEHAKASKDKCFALLNIFQNGGLWNKMSWQIYQKSKQIWFIKK